MTIDELAEQQATNYLRSSELNIIRAEADVETAIVKRETAEVEKRTSELVLQRMQNANRPSLILGAALERDGDGYVATYSCVAGRGETPEAAFANFDSVWTGRE